VLLLAGCGRGIDNKEAVRQAVVEYLSSRTNLNVNSMSVNVTSVIFRNGQADAVVSFAPKGATEAGQGMEMRYTLEKKSNRWVVKAKSDGGSNPHGIGSANPHSTPRPDAGGGSELPPGHPPIGGNK